GRDFRGPPDGGRVSIAAPPGTYTVRLTVGERTFQRPLTVLQDPSSEGTLNGIRQQVAMLEDLRAEANRTTDLIDRIEWVRWQTARRMEEAEARQGLDDVLEAASALAEALEALEMNLFDLRLTGGQDTVRWPRRLYAKITSLASYVGGTDDPPTDQAREVHRRYQEELATHEAGMDGIVQQELAALNVLLGEAGLDSVSDRVPEGS
ncbi:MAG TPA: hypothetical protein VE173_06360, partial [Longimicrobiales bacterium]|nr:hypothetical protein [Longimicrobiales bacterium]